MFTVASELVMLHKCIDVTAVSADAWNTKSSAVVVVVANLCLIAIVYPNAMANAVAFFLLISSPSVPELMFELIKNNPVPPPPAVLL